MLRDLERMQSRRRKQEGKDGAADRAEWAEDVVVRLMAETLPDVRLADEAPAPEPAPPPPSAPPVIRLVPP